MVKLQPWDIPTAAFSVYREGISMSSAWRKRMD